MNYRDEMTKTMTMLGQHPSTIFLGQSVLYKGTAMFSTLQNVPDSKKIEMPVAEEMQLGISTGLALQGFIPVSIFPRMDFLILAMNQLVNHLDKISTLSQNRFCPKVIIRTSVGGKKQLDPGLQHCGNYYQPLRMMLTSIDVYYLSDAVNIYHCYKQALESDKSSILIELGDLYD